MNNLKYFWNSRYRKFGHTGWKIPAVYNYDQKLRLAAFYRLLNKAGFDKSLSCRVLDIGCGTGDFIEIMAGFNYYVTGIDISEEVIEYAKDRFKGNERISIFPFDITEFDFNAVKTKFNLVVSITVFQHITDDASQLYLMKCLYHLLDENGMVILLESLNKPGKEKQAFYLNHKSKAEWFSLFRQAGFEVLMEKSYPHLGVKLTQLIGKCIGNLKRKKSKDEVQSDNSQELSKFSAFMVKVVLFLTYPFDYWLSLPTPKQASDRLFFILKKKNEYVDSQKSISS